MDLNAFKKRFADCPCGKEHDFGLELLEVSHGAIDRVAELLARCGFPKKILMVADGNSFRVTRGLYEQMLAAGFSTELRVFDDMKVADMREVEELEREIVRSEAVLSVGTGSVNDVCRLSAFRRGVPLAIVATAPSMDGFASDSAPITKDSFKISYPCRQPRAIIADTSILATAPTELKAAGFGDVMAKYIAIADWRIAALLHGDYYCERVAAMVREATAKMAELADRVPENSEEAAAAIMETLVLTGLAMQLAGCTRPASGTEHIISHFWECKKLERGLISDYHGKKVGVATLVTADIYHKLAAKKSVRAHAEHIDWDEVGAAYGDTLMKDVRGFNTPNTIVDEIDPALLTEKWDEIRRIVKEEVPTPAALLALYRKAHAVTTPEEIAVDRDLFEAGIRYHVFMRRRVTLMRLLPMIDIDPYDLYMSDKTLIYPTKK